MRECSDARIDENPHRGGDQHKADGIADAFISCFVRRHENENRRKRHADARHHGAGASFARPGLLLGGIEVFDIRMRLHESGMLHACGNDDDKARENAREKTRDRNDVAIMQDSRRAAADENSPDESEHDVGDARGYLQSEIAHMLVIAAYVGSGSVRHRGARVRFERTLRQIALHKVVERAFEDVAKRKELVHFGIAFLGFPFRDGLARHAEQHGELFLRHIAGCAKMLKVVTETHKGCLSVVHEIDARRLDASKLAGGASFRKTSCRRI